MRCELSARAIHGSLKPVVPVEAKGDEPGPTAGGFKLDYGDGIITIHEGHR